MATTITKTTVSDAIS